MLFLLMEHCGILLLVSQKECKFLSVITLYEDEKWNKICVEYVDMYPIKVSMMKY